MLVPLPFHFSYPRYIVSSRLVFVTIAANNGAIIENVIISHEAICNDMIKLFAATEIVCATMVVW